MKKQATPAATIYKVYNVLTRKWETVSPDHLHLIPQQATLVQMHWAQELGRYITVPVN